MKTQENKKIAVKTVRPMLPSFIKDEDDKVLLKHEWVKSVLAALDESYQRGIRQGIALKSEN